MRARQIVLVLVVVLVLERFVGITSHYTVDDPQKRNAR
jgi:hypothetical protein